MSKGRVVAVQKVDFYTGEGFALATGHDVATGERVKFTGGLDVMTDIARMLEHAHHTKSDRLPVVQEVPAEAIVEIAGKWVDPSRAKPPTH